MIPDPSVDFGSDVPDWFCGIRGRERRAQPRTFPHQLSDFWGEGRVISADVAAGTDHALAARMTLSSASAAESTFEKEWIAKEDQPSST